MNQRQLQKEREKWFMEGVIATQDNMAKSLYAAAALAAHRQFGFDTQKCADLLMAIDRIVCDYFTSEEVVNDVLKELNININFKDGIHPVEVQDNDGSGV